MPTIPQGVDRLIRSHQDAGLRRNEGNLYAEMGSLWRYFMSRPDEAAHVMGKLLKYFGEERILWGTDSIWYGSPQDQIQAFRAFTISEEFQERYGYPALTAEAKRKIFGLNGARVYGIDVAALHGRGELHERRRRLSRRPQSQLRHLRPEDAPRIPRAMGCARRQPGLRADGTNGRSKHDSRDRRRSSPSLLLAACARSEDATMVAAPTAIRPCRRSRRCGRSRTTRSSPSANGANRCRTSSAALEFGPTGAPPLFSLRCDARRSVLLQRHGEAPVGRPAGDAGLDRQRDAPARGDRQSAAPCRCFAPRSPPSDTLVAALGRGRHADRDPDRRFAAARPAAEPDDRHLSRRCESGEASAPAADAEANSAATANAAADAGD